MLFFMYFRKLGQHMAKKAKFAKNVDDYESKTSEIQKQINELSARLVFQRKQSLYLPYLFQVIASDKIFFNQRYF